METIRTIIIDDERDSRDIIRIYLSEYFPNIEVVAEADSVNTGLEEIQKHSFDLLFLDVQLKNQLSFEILNQLDSYSFDILFITAHDSYAIQAIKHHAVDYLLKPIDRTEFRLAVENFIAKRNSSAQIDMQAIIAELGSTLQKKQIKLPTLNGFKVVSIDSILYLESDSNYTNFHFADGTKVLVSKTMKEYETQLPTNIFCRIHNSHMINTTYLKEYIKGRGGQVIMTNNTVLNVSQNKKQNLLDLLG